MLAVSSGSPCLPTRQPPNVPPSRTHATRPTRSRAPTHRSPERRAATSLQHFFTFVGARIVLSQLEGIGRGDLGAYNAAGATVLRKHLESGGMRDSTAWLAEVMREDELLAARILEVRAAYAQEEFEWQNLQRLAIAGIEADNARLLRQHATARFGSMLNQAGPGEERPQ